MPVGGIDDDDIDAGLDQRGNALVGPFANADSGTDAQTFVRILARVGKLIRLLNVLDRDHAAQLEVVVDHENLLDAVLVQQADDLVFLGVLGDGDQAPLRRHDLAYRRVEARLEAQVAAGHDADQLAAIDDRHAGDALRAGQREHVADACVRRGRNGIADNAALELLDRANLQRLFGRAHVLVDDPDAAFLGHGNREARLGHGVHRRRQQRYAQLDVAGQAGAQIGFPRQDLGVVRQQQHIIESEAFVGDAHRGRASV